MKVSKQKGASFSWAMWFRVYRRAGYNVRRSSLMADLAFGYKKYHSAVRPTYGADNY